jgi:putative ATPase
MENIPLAERMRPRSLDTFVGQQSLVGNEGPIRKMIEQNKITSMIFWGPPGVGKTTLAEIIATHLGFGFIGMSAVSVGVKDIKEVIERAKLYGKTVLFLDEIHRFNKSQQDSLLGAVEKGYLTLIGATTENPSFEVNHALLSRAQVFVFESLTIHDIQGLLQKSLLEDSVLSRIKIVLNDNGLIAELAGGDARKALNLLELAVSQLDQGNFEIEQKTVLKVAGRKMVRYDKASEQHYDIISAFIKSIRGSDPNAALYWLARMIEGGEDPLFISRRMLILAAEDIGNANPNALLLAQSCFQAVHAIGMPEARIILAQVVSYLATSPKSNSAYNGIEKALAEVRKSGDLEVPLHLRNAPSKLMKDLGYSKGYEYSHHFPQNFSDQEYLPEPISGTVFYEPSDNLRENELRQFLKIRWKEKYGY